MRRKELNKIKKSKINSKMSCFELNEFVKELTEYKKLVRNIGDFDVLAKKEKQKLKK